MRGFLVVLVLILVAALSAPWIDGWMFKNIYLQQVAMYQKRLQAKNINIEVVKYDTGWLKSNAELRVSVNQPENSSAQVHLPPMVMTINSVIHHGPLIVDPKTNSYKFSYALVETFVHLPDVLKVFIPDTDKGFMQVTSTVPFDGKTWVNHYVIPPVNVLGKLQWRGLTGDATIIYSENSPMNVDGNSRK